MSLLLLFNQGGDEPEPPGPLPPRLTDPPLDIYAEIAKPDGSRHRWDGESAADSIPQNVRFSTKRMEGFSTASLVLPRRIDEDYVDVGLCDELTLLDSTGKVVYEGFVSSMPRELGPDGHSIQVEAVGWMATARDRPFADVIVSRDPSKWGEMSLARRARVLTFANVIDADYNVTAEGGGLKFDGTTNKSVPAGSIAEAHFAMPVDTAAVGIAYKGTQANTSNVEAATLVGSDTDDLAANVSAALTLDDAVRLASLTAARRHLMLRVHASGTHTPTAALNRTFSQLAVVGETGLALRDVDDDLPGVWSSDALRYIFDTYCPELDTSGIEDVTYPQPDLAWFDLVDPYDAALEINKPHLLDLAVWEAKRVYYYAVDLNDYDWQVRLDDPGVTVQLQGDSTDDLASGIVIEYDDLLTGRPNVLYPTDHAELRDESESNPYNSHNRDHWARPPKLSTPTTEANALQIGRALLAENNQVKGPGSITVEGGYIRDRAGNWQPVSNVRATQTIAIVNHPNSRPRLIHETEFTTPGRVTIAVDSAIRRVDAYLDRVATRAGARGLAAA